MLLIEDVFIDMQTSNRYDAQSKRWVQSTVIHYYYKDIIALNMDKEGTLLWSTLIPKRQYAIGSSLHLSFYQQIVGEKLYLVFPDHANNTSLEASEGTETYSRNSKVAMLAVVVIDLNTGEAKKEKVFGFLPKKD